MLWWRLSASAAPPANGSRQALAADVTFDNLLALMAQRHLFEVRGLID